jgi:hypothetical protein
MVTVVLILLFRLLSQGRLLNEIQGSNTIRNFLSHTPEAGYPGHSMIAMNTKAAILFHRSAQLTGQWTPSTYDLFFLFIPPRSNRP